MPIQPIADDGRPACELINILLTVHDEDEADSAHWNAMRVLHRRANVEVFVAARSLCESPCPLEQRIGCNILAQLGWLDERPFASASLPLVASVIRRTDNLDTLGCALFALGWLGDRRGVDFVIPYLKHADAEIRYSVTHALTALDDDPRSIDGLIRLTTDPSAKVRDWATFGLGSQIDQDTPAIREALVARLDDADEYVRGEALVGLAKRQDERVIEPLRRELEAGTYDNCVSDYASDAIAAINDPLRRKCFKEIEM